MFDDFIIIDYKDSFLIVETLSDLPKNWFYNFIFGYKKHIYVYFNNLNLQIGSFTNIAIQFEKDVLRTNFQINYRKFTNYQQIQTLLDTIYFDKEQLKIIMFLCSQTSLAFIMNEIHNSINYNNENYIIAERELKKSKTMKIVLNTKDNWVKIEKKLRIVKENLQTIQNIELHLHFQIIQNTINCLVYIINI